MSGVGATASIAVADPRRAATDPAGASAATATFGGTLYIAAKAPRPGLAKTRLGRAIGDEAAVRLYRAFLRDLAARFARAPFPVGWYVTPANAWGELAPLVGCARWRGPILAQGEGDWTARQRALLRGAFERGEQRTILVASDSPQLPVEVVAEAFALLDHHNVVLGPTSDGGYYLIGMRGWHDVLAGVRMSTGTVLDEILARAAAAGISTGLVGATFDVDEVADLASLRDVAFARADLAATRAALAALDRLALSMVAPGRPALAMTSPALVGDTPLPIDGALAGEPVPSRLAALHEVHA